jgi:hypothetical protein
VRQPLGAGSLGNAVRDALLHLASTAWEGLEYLLNGLMFAMWSVIELLFAIIPVYSNRFENWVHYIEAAIAVDLVSSIYGARAKLDLGWVDNIEKKKTPLLNDYSYEFQEPLRKLIARIKSRSPDLIARTHHACEMGAIFMAFFGAFLLYLEVLHPDYQIVPSMQISLAIAIVLPAPMSLLFSIGMQLWTAGMVELAPIWWRIVKRAAQAVVFIWVRGPAQFFTVTSIAIGWTVNQLIKLKGWVDSRKGP